MVLTWMGADTSADRRERVILADQAVSIVNPARCQHGHVTGNEYIGRTCVAAGRGLKLRAHACAAVFLIDMGLVLAAEIAQGG